jgi:hypothetical protein
MIGLRYKQITYFRTNRTLRYRRCYFLTIYYYISLSHVISMEDPEGNLCFPG